MFESAEVLIHNSRLMIAGLRKNIELFRKYGVTEASLQEFEDQINSLEINYHKQQLLQELDEKGGRI